MRVTIPDAEGLRGFAPRADKGAVPEAPRFACAPAALFPCPCYPHSRRRASVACNRAVKVGADPATGAAN